MVSITANISVLTSQASLFCLILPRVFEPAGEGHWEMIGIVSAEAARLEAEYLK